MTYQTASYLMILSEYQDYAPTGGI